VLVRGSTASPSIAFRRSTCLLPGKRPDYILEYSAVELFVARTKALNAGFSPQAEDLVSIATICRRLDGIPLAIEFAAARAAVLSVQLSRRLARSLRAVDGRPPHSTSAAADTARNARLEP
jgi:predicted ATPase